MAFRSRGLRGALLETLINLTNERYRDMGLALVNKVPTPITPVKINDKGQITLAYFESKSTVDYIGVVQGIPVCFDAKECSKQTFPMQNVHIHQYEFMEAFEKQDGIAFLIIYFSSTDEYYYCPFRELKKFFERMNNGGKKSIKKAELTMGYYLATEGIIPYLDGLKMDLEERG